MGKSTKHAPYRLAVDSDTIDVNRSIEAILTSFDKHGPLIAALLPLPSAQCPTSSLVSVEYITSMFTSSLQLFSDAEVVRAAASDSVGFVVPESIANSVQDIIAAGSVASVAASLQQKYMNREVNAQRFAECERLLPDEGVDKAVVSLARTLASTGSVYCVQPDYNLHLSHRFESMRPRIHQIGLCALKHSAALCADGKGLLLDVRQMPDGPENFFRRYGIDTKAKAHHTAKYNSDGSLRPAGRFLQDLNEDPDKNGYFLHAEENKVRSRLLYGDYIQEQMVRSRLDNREQPSSFLQRIYDLCVAKGWQLHELRGIVEDNKGAFNAIRVDPASVSLVCMRVSEHFCFIPTSNGFGITSTPSAWDTLCKVIDYNIKSTIFGILYRWTDDRAIVTHIDFLDHDRQILHAENVRMFGPDPYPLDLDKSQAGAVIVCVGYSLKFIPGTISPNEKGVKKLLVVFFVADIQSGSFWPLKFCQKVASLADRYSHVILGMRGFASVFYTLLRLPDDEASTDNRHRAFSVRYPNSAHRFAVMLWRCVVLTLLTRPGLLDVPMFSLVNRHAEVIP